MKQRVYNILSLVSIPVLLVILILLSSCERELNVKNVYPFTVSHMPYPKSLKSGTTAELRMNLSTSAQYDNAVYTVRFFIEEGVGQISLNGETLKPNDRYRIYPGDFRIYYTSRSKSAHKIEFVFEDNNFQSQAINIAFANEDN